MSTLVETRHASRSSVGQLALGAIVGGVRLVILWRELRSARRLLQGMSDGGLSDIGVPRSSIDYAAAFGRDRGTGSIAFTSR